MRILYIGKYYHPIKGGIETVSKALAEGMVKLGHEVTILAASEELITRVEKINSVKVVRLGTWGKLFSQPLSFALFWNYIKYAKKSDIIHIHTPNPLVELFALCFIWFKPIVVSYHSDIINQKKLLTIYAPFLKLFLKKVSRIHVSSEQLKQNSKFLNGFKDKVEIVPFGIEPHRFQYNSKVEHLIKENKNKYGKYFLFVGRLVPYKGLLTLIDAVKDISTNLIIVGEGPEKSKIQQKIKKLNLEKKVLLLDHIDNEEEFSAYFYGAYAFVLPSNSDAETFGIVLMEALSCSIPCISTKLNTGVRSVNINDQTGIEVAPDSQEELSNGMNKLLDNPELRNRLAEGAKKHYMDHFTDDKMISNMNKFYEHTLS